MSVRDRARTDERKWTRAFTRLEKAVQRHRDKKAWTDDADDELHRVLDKVLRDVGPTPPDAGGSEAREVARILREFARSPKLPPSTVFIELADRLDRAPTREGPTRDEIADTAQDAAADCGKPLDPDVADVIAARVLALSPSEPCE
jgi:hypothetical protein